MTVPRGLWVRSDRGEGYEWAGPEKWGQTHGKAVVAFDLGEIHHVFNCLLPDGTRKIVHCGWYSDVEQEGLNAFYKKDEGGVRGGEIEIDPEEVRFVPSARLDDDLLASPRISKLAQEDVGFALRLYAALCNNNWFRGGRWEHMSFRSAARLVSRLRGSDGSDYTEIYVHREDNWPDQPYVSEGDVAKDVVKELALLGWKNNNNPWPDLEEDLKKSARIKGLVQDRDFAERLYRALCYVMWLKDDRARFTGPSGASLIVAELQNRKETPADFAGIGDQGLISDDVGAELAALGWTPKSRNLIVSP